MQTVESRDSPIVGIYLSLAVRLEDILLLCSVLGQDDLVATDILVRGVNLYNKLLTESFVSNVQWVWPLRSTPCPPRDKVRLV